MSFNFGSEGNIYLTDMDIQDQDAYPFDYRVAPDNTYPQGCDVPSPGLVSSEWVSPPQSTYLESPLSTGGTLDPSWDLFDQSFASTQTSMVDGSFSTSAKYYLPNTYQTAFTNSSRNASGIQPSLNLAAVAETTSFGDEMQDDNVNNDQTNGISLEPLRPNWAPRSGRGGPLSSSDPTNTLDNSSHRKSTRSHHSRTKSESSTRLRSTQSSNPRQGTSHFSASSSSSENNTKRNHNHVEKQYRNRLNDQFEALLRVLSKHSKRDGEKKVSKGEVLVLAKEVIREMERETTLREGETERLEAIVEDLKRKWVGLGGICMP